MMIWKAFLRIDTHLLKDVAPDADAAFLVSKGIEESAPIVLHHLRKDVLPLVRRMKPDQFWFSVHNRESGVPTTEDDKNAYIDLTMMFENNRRPLPDKKWCMARTVPNLGGMPAGWKGLDVRAIYDLLHRQSDLVLRFIELHPKDFDNFELLKQLRQFLHAFANISQMRIS